MKNIYPCLRFNTMLSNLMVEYNLTRKLLHLRFIFFLDISFLFLFYLSRFIDILFIFHRKINV